MAESLPDKIQENIQSQPQQQNSDQAKSSSSEDVDFDPNDTNQKFFNLADVKPLDFKSKWLGNTNQLIDKYQIKLSELHRQKNSIKQQFQRFAQNQNRFKISSLRKINLSLNKKQIYNEYISRTRRTIQKLHPSLIINICSYVSENTFLALSKIRRVSKVFNIIYNNENVIQFFSQRNFSSENMSLEMQQKWCQRYIQFKQAFLYYKQIKYTVLIPQNSIKQDLEKAVDFINEVYKRTFAVKSTRFGYFHLINKFMKQHRIVQALESLTFTDLAVTKRASIVAFSNYLAFNSSARQREEITKTRYLMMIQMVEDEYYRDSLFINSKISNFLQDQFNQNFAVFIDTLKINSQMKENDYKVFDLVVYHLHNDLRSSFLKGVVLSENAIQIGQISLQFGIHQQICCLNYRLGNRLESEYLRRLYLPTFVEGNRFGECYIYRGQFYYILLIRQLVLSQE